MRTRVVPLRIDTPGPVHYTAHRPFLRMMPLMSVASPPPDHRVHPSSTRSSAQASSRSAGNLDPEKSRRVPRTSIYLLLAICGGLAMVLGWLAIQYRNGGGGWLATDAGSDASGDDHLAIPSIYDPDRAMGYLVRICDFGPRPSGTDAMAAQQDYLEAFFVERGGTVTRQSFEIRHPQTGLPTPITNLIASWNADAPARYLLCAHYDTRPFPDNDRRNPRGIFVGANDGGSGTAALMEWSHQFQSLPDSIGVDVVLFDAEELVYDNRRDEYFIGSTYFAQQHAAAPQTEYVAGILLDMVGDKYLQLFYERNSLRYAPELTRSIWETARRLGSRNFVPRARHEVLDDHLPLNKIAKIPTTDLIDFDYPRPGADTYWHTTLDVPAQCSGRSLVHVVFVLDTWLKNQIPDSSLQQEK